jgi:hypothetical protein
MGFPGRARTQLGPSGVRALVILVAATGWASGCGRVGFDAVDDGGFSLLDASIDGGSGPRRDASDDAFAPADAAPEDAPSSNDGAASDADAAGCIVSTVADYCAAVPPLPAPPTIDGVLDCGPALVAMTPVDWNGPPPLPPFPAGNATSLAVAWRPDGLYVFVDVTTPAAFPAAFADPVFYGAGIELFVDDDGVSANPPAYDDPGAIQFVVAAPGAVISDAGATGQRAEGFRNAADEGPWASRQFGTFATPTGFVFEAFVAAADLGLASWSLAAGGKVGLDLSTDASFTTASTTGPQGHRVGQYFLSVEAPAGDASAPTTPYADPRAFCTPTLTPR